MLNRCDFSCVLKLENPRKSYMNYRSAPFSVTLNNSNPRFGGWSRQYVSNGSYLGAHLGLQWKTLHMSYSSA